MTIVAAYNDGGKIWIASDSAASEGDFITDIGTKLIQKPKYVVGCSWSCRVGDIIREAEGFPDEIRNLQDVAKFRANLKQLMIDDGALATASEGETLLHPISLLVVAPSGIYTIDNDYGIFRVIEGYHAIGSGREVATGVLFAGRECKAEDGNAIVTMAVRSAIQHIGSCDGEVHIISVDIA